MSDHSNIGWTHAVLILDKDVSITVLHPQKWFS
jgi:hypothetical protein